MKVKNEALMSIYVILFKFVSNQLDLEETHNFFGVFYIKWAAK